MAVAPRVEVGRRVSSAMRAREKKKKEATPDMFSLLDARDYTGAITLIEFERKMFLDKKHGACENTNSANARAPFTCDKPWAVERRVSARLLADISRILPPPCGS